MMPLALLLYKQSLTWK